MKLTPLKSSNLEGCHYDPKSKLLTVKFKNGGTYNYHQVSPDLYEGLTKAESAGTFLHKRIKGNHKFARSDKTD